MTTEQIQFYLEHRRQISEWAGLDKRVNALMRDAVKEGDQDKAISILRADSRVGEVDFYVRNRSQITEWDALQVVAGSALHNALLAATREAGCAAHEGKGGWTEAAVHSPKFDQLLDEQRIWIRLAWTKQHLLSTRRGFPFPRLALQLHPDRWNGENRDMLITATRPAATELGMTKHDKWWVHWRVLDAISESQADLRSYADECIAKLQDASERLYPVLTAAIAAAGTPPLGSDTRASTRDLTGNAPFPS